MLHRKHIRVLRFCLVRAAAGSLMLFTVAFAGEDPSRAAGTNELTQDAIRADRLFGASNSLDALPIYEKLVKQDPTNAVFIERLAFCLMVQFELLPDGEAKKAAARNVKKIAERAKALGDNSNLLGVIFDRVNHYDGAPVDAETLKLRDAEAAFARGELDVALIKYQEIAAADPHSYQARLYAGDVLYRQGELDQAMAWFQKAVDVDPDRETAYRYWGDALTRAGERDSALGKFLDAVIAEPYMPRSWMGLKQWAQQNHATLNKPSVPTPGATTDLSEIVKPLLGIKAKSDEAWTSYSRTRVEWRQTKFAKQNPGEPRYRHTLAEEVESLQAVLLTLGARDAATITDEAAFKDLRRLSNDGMLEAYVLLSTPDEGIARDYAGYRATHRDQLRAYLTQYVVKR